MTRTRAILLVLLATLGATATGCHRRNQLCDENAGYRGADYYEPARGR